MSWLKFERDAARFKQLLTARYMQLRDFGVITDQQFNEVCMVISHLDEWNYESIRSGLEVIFGGDTVEPAKPANAASAGV